MGVVLERHALDHALTDQVSHEEGFSRTVLRYCCELSVLTLDGARGDNVVAHGGMFLWCDRHTNRVSSCPVPGIVEACQV